MSDQPRLLPEGWRAEWDETYATVVATFCGKTGAGFRHIASVSAPLMKPTVSGIECEFDQHAIGRAIASLLNAEPQPERFTLRKPVYCEVLSVETNFVIRQPQHCERCAAEIRERCVIADVHVVDRDRKEHLALCPGCGEAAEGSMGKSPSKQRKETVMGYMTDGLTFNALRGANIARMPEFKNKHGELAHSKPDGSDWSPAQWLQAVVGELGEYANLRKKYERGDVSEEEFHVQASDELADVVTYLDILAHQLGIDLGRATREKFNRVSERVGSSVKVDAHGWYRSAPSGA